MTKEEADKLKLKNASFHFREFSGKRNFAPPSDQSTWYELLNVLLDNSKLFGDEVGVVKAWAHPGAKDIELTPYVIAEIKRVVGAHEWQEHYNAALWVGKAIAEVVGLDPVADKSAIERALKALLASGALKRKPGKTSQRKPTMFVVPGEDASRFQIIGPEPNAPCAQCGGTDQPVYLIRDPFRGVASTPLHERCAADFYKQEGPTNGEDAPVEPPAQPPNG
jgi:hypothetical protein